jgi:hypothetical protein
VPPSSCLNIPKEIPEPQVHLEVYTAALIERLVEAHVDRALCRAALLEKSQRDSASAEDKSKQK